MNDLKKQLKEAYAVLQQRQKNKKGVTEKFDTIGNFKGKKGVNDAGIPLTQKTIKKQQRNRLNYHYRYPAHLKAINDAKHKAALKRWGLENKKPIVNVPAARRSNTFHPPHYRAENSFTPTFQKRKKLYIYYDNNFGNYDDGSVELDPNTVDAACSSVIHQELEFKNKVEEEIYRLKNKKF